jgi:hypothetical protein
MILMIVVGNRFGYIVNWPARGDLAVSCPSCRCEAVFTSPYGFLRREAAERAAGDSRLQGVRWSGGFVVVRFPDTFPWRDRNNPYTQHRRGQIWGVISCGQCAFRKKHLLDWPADAFYKIDSPAGMLWAYTRAHLVQIRAAWEGIRRAARLT